MRLPKSAHTAQSWRIHDVAPDFRLEDVWALPTPGEPTDFPELVRQFAVGDPAARLPGIARALWTVRFRIGRLLGMDGANTGVGSRVVSLRERLPADLRGVPSGPVFTSLPFTPLYLLADEFAAEMANRTVHGVLHLGWVANGRGGYRGQMAVLVKPNGVLGSAYMAAINPFRHLVVYPAAMREIERAWKLRRPQEASGDTA